MEIMEEICKNSKTINNEKYEIDEFLEVLNFRETDVVNKELLPLIKNRLDKIENSVNDINETVLKYRNKLFTTNGCTYDILRPCGKIEIGLCAPNKEFLVDIFKRTGEDIQILRVINENGVIVESYKPHWRKNDFEGLSGGPLKEITKEDIFGKPKTFEETDYNGDINDDKEYQDNKDEDDNEFLKLLDEKLETWKDNISSKKTTKKKTKKKTIKNKITKKSKK